VPKKRKNALPRPTLPPAWISLLRLVHPFPSLIVVAVTVAFAFVAESSPDPGVVAMLGVGMLCYQFSIGITNDIYDTLDDAKAKQWKAMARGLISRRAAVLLAVGLAALGMVLTAGLPFGSWLIGIAGLACGLAYDVHLKRTTWSWLPFAIAFPLIPIWVFTALDEWDGLLWWVLPLGPLLGLALHLANQAPDVPKEAHIRGMAHRLGSERAANLALGLLGLAGIVATLVLLAGEAPSQALVVGATVLLSGVLAKRAVRTFGPDGLFGLLASSTAIMAVAFVSATG
jgi:4-hydroxybenzoate polyprenyltransferase